MVKSLLRIKVRARDFKETNLISKGKKLCFFFYVFLCSLFHNLVPSITFPQRDLNCTGDEGVIKLTFYNNMIILSFTKVIIQKHHQKLEDTGRCSMKYLCHSHCKYLRKTVVKVFNSITLLKVNSFADALLRFQS